MPTGRTATTRARKNAFQKYIQLIPKDPNPYDSYAELLLKMGRYDNSIAQYRKALEIEPNFVNAHQGIAMALLYPGKPDDAEKELAEFSRKARNDGEKRTALFARTVVHIDSGQIQKALADVDERYAVAEKDNDVAGMAFDRGLKGQHPRSKTAKPDAAQKEFDAGTRSSSRSRPSRRRSRTTRNSRTTTTSPASRSRRRILQARRKEADEYRQGAATREEPLHRQARARARRDHRARRQGLRQSHRRARRRRIRRIRRTATACAKRTGARETPRRPAELLRRGRGIQHASEPELRVHPREGEGGGGAEVTRLRSSRAMAREPELGRP